MTDEPIALNPVVRVQRRTTDDTYALTCDNGARLLERLTRAEALRLARDILELAECDVRVLPADAEPVAE